VCHGAVEFTVELADKGTQDFYNLRWND